MKRGNYTIMSAEKESKLIELFKTGFTNREIAYELGLDYKRVCNKIYYLKKKGKLKFNWEVK